MEGGGELIIRVLSAQPCLAAGQLQPEPAAHSEQRRGGKGLGRHTRPRLRRAGNLAGSCTPTPARAGEGQTDQQTDGVAGSRLHACAALPSFPPVLPAGRPAPLRAFGPGSRSCDVISQASALSSDSQPLPAGPGVQTLFTAAWAGSGAEKPARAPPDECRGSRAHRRPHPHRVSTCSRDGASTHDTQAQSPYPHPPYSRRTHCKPVRPRGRLHFAIPAPSIKPRVGDKRSAISPSRIVRGKTRPGLQNPGHVKRAGDFQQFS